MEPEDRTPQIEDRSLAQALAACGMSGSGEEKSNDLTPSSDDLTQARPIPGRSRGRGEGEEEDLSQSYHEIFDTQAYCPSNETAIQEAEVMSPRLPDTEGARGPEVLSPDPGESEHSGSTETGQPVQGAEVYYSGGRLVCEDDSERTRQYLTSKLVADSLMWQETFRNDSPSPDERDTAKEGSSGVFVLQPPAALSSSVDPALVEELERQARRLATDVDSVVENLACILQSISALTVDTVETYRDGVCKTCDAVDDNIKGMYQLMAKWEELNKAMAPAYKASQQIKEIKRLLDIFEAVLANS